VTRTLTPVRLRPRDAGDEAFVLGLYESTREDVDAFGFDPAGRARFVLQQFQAREAHFARAYPAATDDLVAVEGGAIGRIVVDRGDEAIRVVDVALLPAQQGLGIGTCLLSDVCSEGRGAGCPVQLSVLRSNRARRLYERLGFTQIGEDDMYLLMEWRAA
jgi:ribosomal protein S18 acetylase RimI-like enzyme